MRARPYHNFSEIKKEKSVPAGAIVGVNVPTTIGGEGGILIGTGQSAATRLFVLVLVSAWSPKCRLVCQRKDVLNALCTPKWSRAANITAKTASIFLCAQVCYFARVIPTSKLRQNWWRVAALVAVWLWLYHDVIRRLVDDWRVDENYSHGFLIPFISGYAVWTLRRRLQLAEQRPRVWLGGLLVGGAVMLHLAGVLSGELYATRLSLVVSLGGLVLYFYGAAWLRLLAFPLGLLLLALPVPSIIFNPLTFRLQLLASDYATRAIKACGIPALREGNVIELAHLKLQVVEACSGIRSLMTLLTLAVVYAYFFEKRLWRRVALVLAVAPIAVLANAARVAGTGVLAQRYGAQAAEGFMHGFSGALVFLAAVLLLLAFVQLLNLLERLLRQRRRQPTT